MKITQLYMILIHYNFKSKMVTEFDTRKISYVLIKSF